MNLQKENNIESLYKILDQNVYFLIWVLEQKCSVLHYHQQILKTPFEVKREDYHDNRAYRDRIRDDNIDNDDNDEDNDDDDYDDYHESEYILMNGKKHGLERLYLNNKCIEEKNWKNGKLHGRNIFRNYSGKIYQISPYQNNLLDGQQITFFESGKVESESNFKNGKLHGLHRRWNVAGSNLVFKNNYQNGQLHGSQISYFTDGKILSKCYYQNDKKNGFDYEYYQNGQLKWKKYWKNDKEHDFHLHYHPNGKTAVFSQFISGVKICPTKVYDSNGKLLPRNKVLIFHIDSYKVFDESYLPQNNWHNDSNRMLSRNWYQNGPVAWPNDPNPALSRKWYENGPLYISEYWQNSE